MASEASIQENASIVVTAEEEKSDDVMSLTRFPVIHYGRALFQQYLVDLGARLDDNRLNYVRFHQEKLHIERYNGLYDAMADDDIKNAGKPHIVLPSSHNGSPRDLQQRYQDALKARHAKPFANNDVQQQMEGNQRCPSARTICP